MAAKATARESARETQMLLVPETNRSIPPKRSRENADISRLDCHF
jgi:hypothetical protein